MIYLLCILLPPLAVLLSGKKTAFVLNLILTCCLWIPGVIHAILVVNGAQAEKRHKETLTAIEKNEAKHRSTLP